MIASDEVEKIRQAIADKKCTMDSTRKPDLFKIIWCFSLLINHREQEMISNICIIFHLYSNLTE
jgi:hypothetical protein